MPLDAICLNALAHELRGEVVGARIDKVQQPGHDTLILTLRNHKKNFRLLVSAGVGKARVHITTESFENPQSPPMFCMLLRKHLTSARINALSQPDFERLFIFELDALDEMGVPSSKKLIVEMMGRSANIILAGEQGHIIDCLRRVDGDISQSQSRQILPGLIYRLPPQQNKPNFLCITQEERERLWKIAPENSLTDKWLMDSFAGISPLVCRELSFLAFGDPSKAIGLLTAPEKDALLDEMHVLAKRVANADFSPTMLLREEEAFDFTFMSVAQYGDAVQNKTFPGFCELLEAYFTRRDKEEQLRQKSQTLYKSVKNAHERAIRKLAARRMELLKTAERDLNRKFGDIVTANLYRIKKGDGFLEAEDYFEDGGEGENPKITIPLDRLKTPQENAARYYREYNKAKTAEKYLESLIEKGENEEVYLASVLSEIRRAENERDLAEIRLGLQEAGFLKLRKAAKGKKAEKIKETPPQRFFSTSGMEILVGKNNLQNDKLTFKTARRTDLWFHAQKLHGSHVVLSLGGVEQADDKTLLEAAALAAYYSQGRDQGKVPVDYTQVRFVKKPKGAMPGSVIYTDYKTIVVEPDEELVGRLKKV